MPIKKPKRRRTDQAVAAPDVANGDDGQASQWTLACASRLVGLDPSLSLTEAIGLAKRLKAFERTAAMGPEQAADFVAQGMRNPATSRFERRTRAPKEAV